MIDYSKYTQQELEESLRSIDSEKFPGNYKNLIAEIEKRERLSSNEGEIESDVRLLTRVARQATLPA